MSVASVESLQASWGTQGGAWAVLVHGGAGDVAAARLARHVEGCAEAARAAAAILREGGSALDAVERAVAAMEDDPVFNAGTGACLNAQGLIELDACIMDGASLRAGGVCALPPFPHPIAVARAALDDGRHVLYAGEGGAQFALERGFVRSSSEAMTTPEARERWNAVRTRPSQGTGGGTVGAVALDLRGHVACATSTGGRVNKSPGRVGDSPIPGAGSYADDDGGAASATGDGEAVLRLCVGKSTVDRMRERAHPEEAARVAIRTMRDRIGGTGGIILVDREGRLGWARSTRTMTWAAAGQAIDGVLSGG